MKPLNEVSCASIHVDTGTDMHIHVDWGDTGLLDNFVLEPTQMPEYESCFFNHTYTVAGTYSVNITAANNRSFETFGEEIEMDGQFDCNMTLNHSEWTAAAGSETSPALINLDMVGATRATCIFDIGEGAGPETVGSMASPCIDETGQLTKSVTYSDVGIYNISVTVTNTQKSCVLPGVLAANVRITNLDITSMQGGKNILGQPSLFSQTMDTGSHVSCDRGYGDPGNAADIVFCDAPGTEMSFNHTYAEIGVFTLTFTCGNYLGEWDMITLYQIVQEEVIFVVSEDDTSAVIVWTDDGSFAYIGFTVSSGTNVTFTSYINGETEETGTIVQESSEDALVVETTTPINGRIKFLTINFGGNCTLLLNGQNTVSNLSPTIPIQIIQPIAEPDLKYQESTDSIVGTNIYVNVSEEIIFELSITKGTYALFSLSVESYDGCGFSNQSENTLGSDVMEVPACVFTQSTLEHSGPLTATFTVSNAIADSETSHSVYVHPEFPVTGFTVTHDNVTAASIAVVFHIVKTSTHVPTNTTVNITYETLSGGDGNVEVMDSEIIDWNSFSLTHSFAEIGIYLATLTISNHVSSMVETVTVQVGLGILDFTYETDSCAVTNQVHSFVGRIEKGADVTFKIDFNSIDEDVTTTDEQEAAQDYNTPWTHTFTHTYTDDGNITTRMNASNVLSVVPESIDIEMQIEHQVANFGLTEPVPTAWQTDASFMFDLQGQTAPTSATCLLDFGDDSTATEAMLFGSAHTHAYPSSDVDTDCIDYTVSINCSNCRTFQVFETTLILDQTIVTVTLDLSPSVEAIKPTIEYNLMCSMDTGTRAEQSIDFGDGESGYADIANTRTWLHPHTYAVSGNYTASCMANNSVTAAGVTQTLEVVVQDPVLSFQTTILGNKGEQCVLLDSSEDVTLSHNGTLHPTDPHIAWSVAGTSAPGGNFHSLTTMNGGNDTFGLLFTDPADVGNHTLSTTLSNLVSNQNFELVIMVQSLIQDSFNISTPDDNVAVGATTVFDVTITGSHADITVEWGDNTTQDIQYKDGPLASMTYQVEHIFTKITPEINISAVAKNCFSLQTTSKTLTVQEKVDLDNMVFHFQNPLKSVDGSIVFNVSIVAGMPEPNDVSCSLIFEYTDDFGGTTNTTIYDDLVTWPWISQYQFDLQLIKLQVKLFFRCSNLVSDETHTDDLVLEQPIMNLLLNCPTHCKTKTPCEYNITADSGSNMNITVDWNLPIPGNTKFKAMTLESPTLVRNFTLFSEDTQTIEISAINNLNLGNPAVSNCSIIMQHPVTAITLMLSNDGFVPVDANAGATLVSPAKQLKVTAIPEADADFPTVYSLSLLKEGEALDTAVVVNCNSIDGTCERTVNDYITEVKKYNITVTIKNEVDVKTQTLQAEGQNVVRGLSLGHEMIAGNRKSGSANRYRYETILEFQFSATVTGGTAEQYSWSSKLGEDSEDLDLPETTPIILFSPANLCEICYARVNVSNGVSYMEEQYNFHLYMPIAMEGILLPSCPTCEQSQPPTPVTTITNPTTFVVTMKASRPRVCFMFELTNPITRVKEVFHHGTDRTVCNCNSCNHQLKPASPSDMNYTTSRYESSESTIINIVFVFETIIKYNMTISAYDLSDYSLVADSFLDVQDVPCAAPLMEEKSDAVGYSITSSTLQPRSETHLFTVGDYYTITILCEKTNDISQTWELYKLSGSQAPALINFTTSSCCQITPVGLNLLKKSLIYGDYMFNVTVCMGNPPLPGKCDTKPIYFKITQTDMTCALNPAEIKPLTAEYGSPKPFTMDCDDLDGILESSDTGYKWFCNMMGETLNRTNVIFEPDEAPQAIFDATTNTTTLPPGCFGTGPGYFTGGEYTDNGILIDTSMMLNPNVSANNMLRYDITAEMTVNLAHLGLPDYTATVSEVVEIGDEMLDVTVKLNDKKIGQQYIIPDNTEEYVWTVSKCKNCDENPVQITWTLDPQPLIAPVIAPVSTQLESKYTMGALSLVEARTYSLEVHMFAPLTDYKNRTILYDLLINKRPFDGKANIFPPNGSEACTEFTIGAQNWQDEISDPEGGTSQLQYYYRYYKPGASSMTKAERAALQRFPLAKSAEDIYLREAITKLPKGRASDNKIRIEVEISDGYTSVYKHVSDEGQAVKPDPACLGSLVDDLTEMNTDECALDYLSCMSAMVMATTAISSETVEEEIITTTTTRAPGVAGPTAAEIQAELDRQEAVRVEAERKASEQASKMIDTLGGVASGAKLPDNVAVEIAASLNSMVSTMTENADPENQNNVLDVLASAAASQLDGAEPAAQQEMVTSLLGSVGNMLSMMDIGPTAVEEEEVDLDATPDDSPGGIANQAAKEEAQKKKEEAAKKSSGALANTVASAGKAMTANLGNETIEIKATGLAMSLAKSNEDGLSMPAGDVEFDIGPCGGNASEGAALAFQLANSATNVYTWDPSSNDVTGNVMINAFENNGEPPSEPIVPDEPFTTVFTNKGDPIVVDFSNHTVANETGMIYTSFNVSSGEDAFIFTIERPSIDTHFTLAFLFNGTLNGSDPANKPTLTYNDLLVQCHGDGDNVTFRETPDAAPEPALKRRRKKRSYRFDSNHLEWTFVIKEKYMVPGILNIGILVDPNGTYTHNETAYNDTIARGGFNHQNVSTMGTNFGFSAIFSRCRTWTGAAWTTEYCKVDGESTMNHTMCSCPEIKPEIKSFSSGVTVPGVNKIDFNHLFDNFGALMLESWLGYTTISIIWFFYVVFGIYFRKKDKRDIARWTVYPLKDNLPGSRYYYKISVHTGVRNSAGTSSTVCFILSGEHADTGLRVLHNGKKRMRFPPGTVRHFVLSTRVELGALSFLRIWHDNSGLGENASWYLDKIVVEDLQVQEKFYFLCSAWLSVDEGDGLVQRMLPVANDEEVIGFNHLFYSTARSNLTDGHLWFSAFSRPTRSNFTRLQRLTCCMVLLFTTMLANMMWYKEETPDAPDFIILKFGPILLSLNVLYTSVMGSLTVIPINIIVIQLFRKSKTQLAWELPQDIARKQWQNKRNKEIARKAALNKAAASKVIGEKEVRDMLFPTDKGQMAKNKAVTQEDQGVDDIMNGHKQQPTLPKVEDMAKEVDEDAQSYSSSCSYIKPKKKKWYKEKYPLPYWCAYVAWVLAVLTILSTATFVWFYSLVWGFDKSARWLSALMLSFIEDCLIAQPIKIVIIAMLVSCIFKKLSDDDDLDQTSDEEKRHNIEATDDEELMDCEGPGSDYTVPEPPDNETLRLARQKRDYEKMMWAIIKEVLSYFMFLMLICFIAWGNKEDAVYGVGRSVHGEFNAPPEAMTAYYVTDMFKFWDWAQTRMVDVLYNKQKYNGQYNTARDRNYLADQVNYKVGPPRLRQLRVPNDKKCKRIFDDLKHENIVGNHMCIDDYSILGEEVKEFYPGWTGELPANYTHPAGLEEAEISERDAFRFKGMVELAGLPYWGNMAWYGGGGYVAELTASPNKASVILQNLKDNMWIDRFTRVVFLEFTVFNSNRNLFAYVNYVFEMPTIGSIMPAPRVQPFQLYTNHGPQGNMVLAGQILYIFILLYFTYREYKNIRATGCREYLSEPWNCYELTLIAVSIIGISMFAMKMIFGHTIMKDLSENPEVYVNYQMFAQYDDSVNIVVGCICFLATLKFIKLLRFNKHILFLSQTLKRSGMELIMFSITFTVFFIAYGMLALVLFGQHLEGFRSMMKCLATLYSMLLGKFDFEGIRQAQETLGPLFFVTFVLTVYFVLVNMFLGILGIAFYEVRLDNDTKECDEVQMMSFLTSQAKFVAEGVKDTVKESMKKGGSEDGSEDEDDDDDKDPLVKEDIELDVSSRPSSAHESIPSTSTDTISETKDSQA